MQLVKYKGLSDIKSDNLVVGKLYWIDESSKTEKDYRTYVDVYSDEAGTEKLDCVEEYNFLNVSELIQREETVVEVTEKAPYYESYYCPVCEEYVEPESHYCPHCGSVMGWSILWNE